MIVPTQIYTSGFFGDRGFFGTMQNRAGERDAVTGDSRTHITGWHRWAQGSLEWRAQFLVRTCSLLPSLKPLTCPLPDPGWA